jgi:hypothetical protein
MTTGMAGYAANQYSVGQMLIDPSGSFRPNISVPEGTYQPALRDGPIARLEKPLLVPESESEVEGQVDLVRRNILLTCLKDRLLIIRFVSSRLYLRRGLYSLRVNGIFIMDKEIVSWESRLRMCSRKV